MHEFLSIKLQLVFANQTLYSNHGPCISTEKEDYDGTTDLQNVLFTDEGSLVPTIQRGTGRALRQDRRGDEECGRNLDAHVRLKLEFGAVVVLGRGRISKHGSRSGICP